MSSRSRRSRGFPTKVAGILGSVLEKQHLKKRISDCEVFVIWDDVVGENIAIRTAPLAFRRGALKIGVSDHGWLQQLQFLKEEIKEKLNRKLGRDLVESIYFQIGTIEKKAPPVARVAEEMKKVSLPTEEIEKIDQVIDELPSDELRDSMKKLMVKDAKRKKLDMSEG
ncbi:MAG: DUF721 domain-containing protein [Proteobacteria bacterium]|nr:DUF721 domain-containing protein [Pseudomonadota bacterium]